MSYYSLRSSTHALHVRQVWATRYLGKFLFFTLSTMFSGIELWATDTQVRDLSDVWKTVTQRPKGCITFALTLIALRRSAVNLTIDQLPYSAVLFFPIIRCLRHSFCFGQYLMISCSFGILTNRWYILSAPSHSDLYPYFYCNARGTILGVRAGPAKRRVRSPTVLAPPR